MTAANDIRRHLAARLEEVEGAGVPFVTALEYLTALLTLRVAAERAEAPFNEAAMAPAAAAWARLAKSGGGTATEDAWRDAASSFSTGDTTLAGTFTGLPEAGIAPAALLGLVTALSTPPVPGHTWHRLLRETATAYDELLVEASGRKDGPIPVLPTPRPLASAVAQVLAPMAGERVADPAVGTGGLLLALHEHARVGALDRVQLKALRDAASGIELRRSIARLATLNLLLHGVGSAHGPARVLGADALGSATSVKYDVVVGNPRFGKHTKHVGGQSKRTARSDFWEESGDRHMDYIQHVYTMLKVHGRAAVFVPDGALFNESGEGVRRRLLQAANLHTILRLPPGPFQKKVALNVLFFDAKPPREAPWTQETWIYDLRTDVNCSPKQRPLSAKHLAPFVEAFVGERVESERFTKFTYEELVSRPAADLNVGLMDSGTGIDFESIPTVAAAVAAMRASLAEADALLSAIGANRGQSGPTGAFGGGNEVADPRSAGHGEGGTMPV